MKRFVCQVFVLPAVLVCASACGGGESSSTSASGGSGPGETGGTGGAGGSASGGASSGGASSGGASSGGSSLGGATALGSGVNPDKLGKDLTSSDLSKLCFASRAYVDTILSLEEYCTANGSLAASIAYAENPDADDDELRAVCNAGRQECLDGPEPTKVGCIEAVQLSDCEANVAEMELCIKANLDQSVELLASSPECSTLTAAQLSEPSPQPEPSADCVALGDRCPGLYTPN
jgi:hypothetical protein